MTWCQDHVKGQKIFSLSGQPHYSKWLFMCFSSSVIPSFHYLGYLGSMSFSVTYFLSTWDFILCIRGLQCLKNHIDLEMPHILEKEPLLWREQMGPEWAVFPSLWKIQDNLLPWQWYYSHQALWQNSLSVRREVLMGPLWEFLTLTPRGLENGHPEMLLWR